MFAVINVTDIAAVFFLVFLEGILSLDNALVLALMVRHLPAKEQRRALTWGIWGAFAFRFVSLFFLTHLMGLNWIKWVGGGYLIYLGGKHLLFGETQEEGKTIGAMSFWRTILMVELMDIAFSVDSILAAVSLTQNYWVVMLGGVLGIVMMRFAASVFIKLVSKFPRMESTAYLMVLVIGVKLTLQGFDLPMVDFHSSRSPASWLFYGSMLAAIAYGFKGKRSILQSI